MVSYRPKRLKRKPMGEINVVPYIDVMLVLLVIFMVTAPMLTQGVDVALPKADAKPVPPKEGIDPMTVTVDQEGTFFLQIGTGKAEQKPLELISEVVAEIKRDKPESPVYVEGDAGARYEWIVAALVALQRAGVEGVGLLTDPPEGESKKRL